MNFSFLSLTVQNVFSSSPIFNHAHSHSFSRFRLEKTYAGLFNGFGGKIIDMKMSHFKKSLSSIVLINQDINRSGCYYNGISSYGSVNADQCSFEQINHQDFALISSYSTLSVTYCYFLNITNGGDYSSLLSMLYGDAVLKYSCIQLSKGYVASLRCSHGGVHASSAEVMYNLLMQCDSSHNYLLASTNLLTYFSTNESFSKGCTGSAHFHVPNTNGEPLRYHIAYKHDSRMYCSTNGDVTTSMQYVSIVKCVYSESIYYNISPGVQYMYDWSIDAQTPYFFAGPTTVYAERVIVYSSITDSFPSGFTKLEGFKMQSYVSFNPVECRMILPKEITFNIPPYPNHHILTLLFCAELISY